MLPENVSINMATAVCCRYNCHKIYTDILKCIRETNGSSRETYKLLVRYFGRIISYSQTSFVGELNQDLYYRLINDINKDLFLQVKSRRKYGGCNNVFITFFAM